MQLIKNNATAKLLAGRTVQLCWFVKSFHTFNDELYYIFNGIFFSTVYYNIWYIFSKTAYAVIFDNSFKIF